MDTSVCLFGFGVCRVFKAEREIVWVVLHNEVIVYLLVACTMFILSYHSYTNGSHGGVRNTNI